MGIVTDYYARQNRKGRGVVAATFIIPWLVAIVSWDYIRGAPRGNPVSGYGLYHLPILVSYPRSGTNWCRYIIESLSGGRTPGQKRLHRGSRYTIDRAHDAALILPRYESAILLLRDYRECLLRNHADLWQRCADVNEFLEADNCDESPSWFIRNIDAFDQFDGMRMVLYYEDLLTQPNAEIQRIGEFFGIDELRIERCMRECDQMFERSIASYKAGGHESNSAHQMDLGYHRKRLLTDDQASAFDTYFESKYPELFSRYLERYRLT